MRTTYLVPEHNIDSALMLYIAFGIRPGSFSSFLILGELSAARSAAHPMLKLEKLDIIKLMYDKVQGLPSECIGDNAKRWTGYMSLSDNDKGEFLTYLKMKGYDGVVEYIKEAENR